MGQDFCKGCEDNCLLNDMEGDFSKNQYNKPEENIIFKNSEYTDNKTNQSILYTQHLNSNNKSIEYLYKDPKYYNNKMRYPFIFNNSIDKKKLNKIIFNYRIKLLVKSFRQFKILKYNALQKVVIENYFISPSALTTKVDNISNNSKNFDQPDIDLSPKNNYLFIGHKFNDKKEGYGLEVYSDINARYFGGFKNGKKNGYCRYSIYNSEKSCYYFGEVLNNKLRGFGYYENCKNGTKYEGEWMNSMRNGYGIEYYENGSVYKGQFYNGRKNGIGFYKWIDKSSYEGEWLNNFLHGYGKYIYSDGSIYSGNWSYNRINGLGEFIYPSKKTYFGFFKEDIRDGFGILFSHQDKKAFIGFWEKNKQNGLGQFINNNKCIYGKWKNGKLIHKIKSKDEFFNSMTDLEKIYKSNFYINNYIDFYKRISGILSM